MEDQRLSANDLKKQLKVRKAAARERMAQSKALVAARGRTRKQRNRRWRLLLLIILLIIYLCLRSCSCDEPAPVIPPDAALGVGLPSDATVVIQDAAPPPVRRKRAKRLKKIPPRVRPEYSGNKGNIEGWLVAFRGQVAARGIRLAQCFEGVDNAGALRWSVTVDLAPGTVTGHRFEPVAGAADLTPEIKGCLTQVLAQPYRLGIGETGIRRVSMVVEF